MTLQASIVTPLAGVHSLKVWLYFALLSPVLTSTVVTELSEIVAVSVESQNVSPGGVGYQVNTWTACLVLSLTCLCSVDCGHECTLLTLKSVYSLLYPVYFNYEMLLRSSMVRSKDHTTTVEGGLPPLEKKNLVEVLWSACTLFKSWPQFHYASQVLTFQTLHMHAHTLRGSAIPDVLM